MTNQGNQYTEPGATWTDACDGGPFPVVAITYGQSGAPNTQVAGVYTVMYNVSDARGNAATQVTRTVTVAQAQNQLTISNVPEDLHIWCQASGVANTDPTIAAWLAAPTSSDNCNENSQISDDAPSVFPIGQTAVTWTVTDPDLGEYTVEATRNVVIHGLPAAPTDIQASVATICNGSSSSLSATVGAGGNTVVWYSGECGGTQVGSGSPFVVSPTTTTTYYAASQDTEHNCVGVCGDPVTVTVNPIPPAPTAGSNSPVCEGATLNLTASTVAGATYAWTGPNNFTSTEQNPSIANVTSTHAGPYSVTATVNGCTSPADPGATTTVVVNTVPAAPTGGMALAIATHSITWNWSAVPGATAYTMWDVPAGGNQIGTSSSLIMRREANLTENTAYTRYIEASNACGVSVRTQIGPVSTVSSYCIENASLDGFVIGGTLYDWERFTYQGPECLYGRKTRDTARPPGAQRVRSRDGGTGGIYQQIAVESGRRYTFTAWIRAWTGTAGSRSVSMRPVGPIPLRHGDVEHASQPARYI